MFEQIKNNVFFKIGNSLLANTNSTLVLIGDGKENLLSNFSGGNLKGTLVKGVGGVVSTREIITITAKTGNALTISRASEPCPINDNAGDLTQTPQSFDVGDELHINLTAGDLQKIQSILISGTNIKTVNNTSILGSGNLSVSGTWGSIGGTLTNQTDLSNALNAKQANLISGTNIRTINNIPILGSGDLSTKDFGGYGGLGNVTISTNTVIDVGYSIHPCFEYDNLTINAGVTLSFTNCSGKIVWIKVRGGLTNNGTISNNGTNTGGASSFIGSYNNAGSSNGSGSPGVARNTFNVNDHSVLNVMQGGTGGFSTYGTYASGGGGGGVIIIEAHFINNAGTISCNGNNGGNGSAGGGGGGGGQIYLIYNVITGNGTYSAIGGNGGSGSTVAYSGAGGGGYGAGGSIVPAGSIASTGSNGLNYYADSLAPPGTKNTNGGSGYSGGGGGGGGGFIYFKKNNGLII